MSALAHLATVNASVVVPFVIAAIQDRIVENQKQISGLSAVDLGVYNTPEGQLYQDIRYLLFYKLTSSDLLSKQQSQQAQASRSKARRGESRMNAGIVHKVNNKTS